MEIRLPTRLLAALTVTGPGPGLERLTRTWQAGQILTAMALRTLANGHAELRIGGQTLSATTEVPLSDGQVLTLKVSRTGAQPVLKIVELAEPPSATVARAVRFALPRQGPLAPLVANMNAMVHTPERLPISLPEQVANAAKALVNGLPGARSLTTASGLKQAIEESGLFLEARLAQYATGHQTQSRVTDLKAALLRLLHSLDASQRAGRPVSDPSLATATRHATVRSPLQPETRPDAAMPNRSHSETRSQALMSRTDPTLTANRANLDGRPIDTRPPTHAGRPLGAVASGGGRTTADYAPAPGTAGPTLSTPPTSSPVSGARPSLPLPDAQATAPHRPLRVTSAATPSLLDETSLTRAISELTRQASEGLARLQIHQLNLVPTEEAARSPLVVELPVRDDERIDLFRLQIQDETSAKGREQEISWRVTLSFQLVELGRVSATVSVVGNHVAAEIWAEQTDSAQLFQNQLDDLHSCLESAGLDVSRLTCRAGAPRAETTPPQMRELLDLHA